MSLGSFTPLFLSFLSLVTFLPLRAASVRVCVLPKQAQQQWTLAHRGECAAFYPSVCLALRWQGMQGQLPMRGQLLHGGGFQCV